MSYEFYNPTRVLFGAGQLNRLHEQKMPGKKAMLVISNGKSTRASGALDRTMKELSLAGVEVVLFDKVGANPVKEIVEEGGHFAKKEGCDFIVALGGGSVMDRRSRYWRRRGSAAAGRSLGLCGRSNRKAAAVSESSTSGHRDHDNGRNRIRGGSVGRCDQSGNE